MLSHSLEELAPISWPVTTSTQSPVPTALMADPVEEVRALAAVNELMDNDKWKLHSDETPEEMQLKYGNLRNDYNKIKSQMGLLKKAVLEEREKTKSITAMLAEKDAELYRMVSEQDKLSLLNSSYKVRIDKLLKETEDIQPGSNQNNQAAPSAWGNLLNGNTVGPTQQQLASFIQKHKALKKELIAKTEENENLHIQIHEIKRAHAYTTETLEKKMSEVRGQCVRLEETIALLENDKKKIDGNQKLDIERRDFQIESLQSELKKMELRHKAEIESLCEEYSCKSRELSANFSTLSKLRPFEPWKNPMLNDFNVPTYSHVSAQKRDNISSELLKLCTKILSKFSSVVRPVLLKFYFPKWLHFTSTDPTHASLTTLLALSSSSIFPASNFIHHIRQIIEKEPFTQSSIEQAQDDAVWLWKNVFPSRSHHMVVEMGPLNTETSPLGNFALSFDQFAVVFSSLTKSPFDLASVETWANLVEKLMHLFLDWINEHIVALDIIISDSKSKTLNKAERVCFDCLVFLVDSYRSLAKSFSGGVEMWRSIVKLLLSTSGLIFSSCNFDITKENSREESSLFNPVLISWLHSTPSFSNVPKRSALKPKSSISTLNLTHENLSENSCDPKTCLDYIRHFLSGVQKSFRNTCSRFVAFSTAESALPALSPLSARVNQDIVREFTSISTLLNQIDENLAHYNELSRIKFEEISKKPEYSLSLAKTNSVFSPITQGLNESETSKLIYTYHVNEIQNYMRKKISCFLNDLAQMKPDIPLYLPRENKFEVQCQELAAKLIEKEKDVGMLQNFKSQIFVEKSRIYELSRANSLLVKENSELVASEVVAKEKICSMSLEMNRLLTFLDQAAFVLQMSGNISNDVSNCGELWKAKALEIIKSLTDDLSNSTNLKPFSVVLENFVSLFKVVAAFLSSTSPRQEVNSVHYKIVNNKPSTAMPLNSTNSILNHYQKPFYKVAIKLSPALESRTDFSRDSIIPSIWSNFRQKCNEDTLYSLNYKLSNLSVQLQKTEKSLSMWKHEVRCLESNAMAKQAMLHMADVEVEQFKSQAFRLEEELRSSKISYQNMVKEMTDHICELTEKLVRAGNTESVRSTRSVSESLSSF